MCSLIFSFGLTIHLHWSAVAVVPVPLQWRHPPATRADPIGCQLWWWLRRRWWWWRWRRRWQRPPAAWGDPLGWLPAHHSLLLRNVMSVFSLLLSLALLNGFIQAPHETFMLSTCPLHLLFFFMIVITFACSTNWYFEDVMALKVSFLCIFHPVCYLDWREGSCRG